MLAKLASINAHDKLPKEAIEDKASTTPKKTATDVKCFNCGGPHMVRDCQKPTTQPTGSSEGGQGRGQEGRGGGAGPHRDLAMASPPRRDLAGMADGVREAKLESRTRLDQIVSRRGSWLSANVDCLLY